MSGRIGNIFLKNAIAAYSLRRLTSKYTGPIIRIRRDSDNSETDIGFTSNGELDTIAISNFVTGTTNGFIPLWYDQTGNGVHQARTIANQQPQIVSGGTLMMVNSKPALYFNGNMSMRSIINISLTSSSGEWSSFGVANTLDVVNTRVLFSSDGILGDFVTPRIGQFLRNGLIRFQAIGFNNIQTPFNDSSQLNNTNQNILNSIRTLTTVEMFVNGVGNGPTTTTGIPSTGIRPLDIGYRNGIDFSPTFQPFGYIQELIHYNVDVSCYYRNILNVINSYYKVF